MNELQKPDGFDFKSLDSEQARSLADQLGLADGQFTVNRTGCDPDMGGWFVQRITTEQSKDGAPIVHITNPELAAKGEPSEKFLTVDALLAMQPTTEESADDTVPNLQRALLEQISSEAAERHDEELPKVIEELGDQAVSSEAEIVPPDLAQPLQVENTAEDSTEEGVDEGSEETDSNGEKSELDRALAVMQEARQISREIRSNIEQALGVIETDTNDFKKKSQLNMENAQNDIIRMTQRLDSAVSETEQSLDQLTRAAMSGNYPIESLQNMARQIVDQEVRSLFSRLNNLNGVIEDGSRDVNKSASVRGEAVMANLDRVRHLIPELAHYIERSHRAADSVIEMQPDSEEAASCKAEAQEMYDKLSGYDNMLQAERERMLGILDDFDRPQLKNKIGLSTNEDEDLRNMLNVAARILEDIPQRLRHSHNPGDEMRTIGRDLKTRLEVVHNLLRGYRSRITSLQQT